MPRDSTSIFLISRDPEVSDHIGQVLENLPGLNVDKSDSTLSEMNGNAVKLAASHDIILFRTEKASENDLRALDAISKSAGSKAVILALSSGDTSLNDVRRLTAAGVSDVLLDTISKEELSEQIARWTLPTLATHVVAAPLRRQGKLIAVSQARGGIGASSFAVNLADQLLMRTGLRKKINQKTVALVDLDLQFGSISSLLDIEPTNALYDLATQNSAPDEMFLQQAMTTLPSGLSVLTAPAQLMPLDAIQATQIMKMIEVLRQQFDYVLIDLPRALVQWIEPVLMNADRMLLVTDSSVPSIRQARRLIDLYTETNLNLAIDIVVNHENKPLIRGRHHTEAARVLERPLAYWIPHDPKNARESIDRGVPISNVSRRSGITKAVKKIAENLVVSLNDSQAQAAQTKKRKA